MASLIQQYIELEKKYKNLSQAYIELKNENENLQKEYNKLKKEVDELTCECSNKTCQYRIPSTLILNEIDESGTTVTDEVDNQHVDDTQDEQVDDNTKETPKRKRTKNNNNKE